MVVRITGIGATGGGGSFVARAITEVSEVCGVDQRSGVASEVGGALFGVVRSGRVVRSGEVAFVAGVSDVAVQVEGAAVADRWKKVRMRTLFVPPKTGSGSARM